MAPIRRYLRITKYSVLEVRIYLENPALANSWLLNPRAPVLPRVIESVRPLVLPKLREEKERARKKSTKKKAIKDVVVEDDFEVAIFLTETNTRHSILYKHRHPRDKMQTRLRSNSKKLTGAGEGSSLEAAIDLGDDAADTEDASGIELLQMTDGDEIPMLRRENSEDGDEGGIPLRDIPEAPASRQSGGAATHRSKQRRQPVRDGAESTAESIQDGGDPAADDNKEEDYVVVDSDEAGEEHVDPAEEPGGVRGRRPRKRGRDEGDSDTQAAQGSRDGGEKKIKVAMDISYEGFAIYGRVLCLVVKRRAVATTAAAAASASSSESGRARAARAVAGTSDVGGGQARMENWIASTQMMPQAEQAEDG